jgi:hypothetical protein
VQRILAFAEELKQQARTIIATPHEEQIRRRAREIWEHAGKPSGRDEEFWYQAERGLQGDAAEKESPSRRKTANL